MSSFIWLSSTFFFCYITHSLSKSMLDTFNVLSVSIFVSIFVFFLFVICYVVLLCLEICRLFPNQFRCQLVHQWVEFMSSNLSDTPFTKYFSPECIKILFICLRRLNLLRHWKNWRRLWETLVNNSLRQCHLFPDCRICSLEESAIKRYEMGIGRDR